MKRSSFRGKRSMAGWKTGSALALGAFAGATLLGACRSEVPIGVGTGGAGGDDTPSEGGSGDQPNATGGTGGATTTGGATYGGTSTGGRPPVLGGSAGAAGDPGPGGESSEGGRPSPPTDFPGEPLTQISKLDLLLVVDNSFRMDAKQPLFKASLRRLLERVTGAGGFSDIHVGVISTSLGSNGATTCKIGIENDKAYLIPKVRPGLESWNDEGFSVWDPNQSASPNGHDDLDAFYEEVTNAVDAVGTEGCGYEASLEAWYRFLVDPKPSLGVEDLGQRYGVDEALLSQRRAFLRHDSALAVVLLSDENDCSIVDYGQGWLVGLQTYNGQSFNMPRSTSVCATNPNDPCCTSCATNVAPASGCADPRTDPACQANLALPASEDSLNLRCWDQKRRFGIDLLHPVQRYVDALTKPYLPNSEAYDANPLFAAAGGRSRRPSQVLFSAILGVPWQDIASSGSLSGDTLEFLPARELARQERWPLLVPDQLGDQPDDPFMIESNRPRSGQNPITDDELQPPTAPVAAYNAINGHEDAALDQLEAACAFPLPEPRECSNTDPACDCRPVDEANASFNCQAPGSGTFETTQYKTSATPGTRQLQVLREIGDSAVVGSICPKFMDAEHPDGLYKPTFDALADRLEAIAE